MWIPPEAGSILRGYGLPNQGPDWSHRYRLSFCPLACPQPSPLETPPTIVIQGFLPLSERCSKGGTYMEQWRWTSQVRKVRKNTRRRLAKSQRKQPQRVSRGWSFYLESAGGALVGLELKTRHLPEPVSRLPDRYAFNWWWGDITACRTGSGWDGVWSILGAKKLPLNLIPAPSPLAGQQWTTRDRAPASKGLSLLDLAWWLPSRVPWRQGIDSSEWTECVAMLVHGCYGLLAFLGSCPRLRRGQAERCPQLQGWEGGKASLITAPLIMKTGPAGLIPESLHHFRGQIAHLLHSFEAHSVTRELLASH